MTTLHPRSAYTNDELQRLYPKELQLEHVQIILRHGERSPVSPRFQNAGLTPYWPYCHAAKQIRSIVATNADVTEWDELKWRRQLETFGKGDRASIAEAPDGEKDGICLPGEITDKGRATTTALGQRLRTLYVSQLGFMPAVLSDPASIYLRATPMPRALESVQQAFVGLYPASTRTQGMPIPTIYTRTSADETLFPNHGGCKRLGQLEDAFARRAAGRWNDSEDMGYLNKKIGKWMPEGQKVGVDSKPRLSGVMDTVNSTLAHGETTRLPKEFYDEKSLRIIDKIAVEEWYAGYKEAREYRMLGIGPLVGDLVERMVKHTTRTGNEGITFAMSGAHDTTLAATLTSLGAFEGEGWPKYTSHLAVELFKSKEPPMPAHGTSGDGQRGSSGEPQSGWWSAIFGGSSKAFNDLKSSPRKPTEQLTSADQDRLRNYYVRIRYNDKPMTVPGCRAPGKHLDGDESFCTLEAFKAIADKFTPKNWHAECRQNLDKPGMPERVEEAGY